MNIMHTSRLNFICSWRAILSAFAIVACLFSSSLTMGNTLDDSIIEADLLTSPEFEPSQNSGRYLYVQASSLGDAIFAGNASIEGFYQRLYDTSIANLGSATYVPVSVGDNFFVIPTYNDPNYVGDAFVQSRYIRSQVRELVGRHLINADDPAYANESQQLTTLYQNAYNYALTSKNIYGTRLTMSREASTVDMVWPEIRNINGQSVVVPVLYLTASTVANRRVSEHEVFFGGNVTFNSIGLSNVNIKAGRQAFLYAVHDLTVDGAKILGSGDLSLVAGGNINLLSGEIRNKGELQLGADGSISLKSSVINSSGGISISAQNLTAQTVVQRVDYGNGKVGSRFDRITSINSANGDVTVHTSNDIYFQGVHVSAGEGITFAAGGNIYIGSVALNDSFTGKDGNWKVQSSNVEYLVSSLSAEDTIQLMADGQIVLDAAQIASDEGHIEILAGLGITVEDEMAEHRTYKKGKFGKKKKEINDYQTVAIRSVLDAGKGVRLHTDFGDITLKASEITSAEGARVSASNGYVNLLLSKELDHYSKFSIYESKWKIKTRNEGHYIETAIPNAIVGGFVVEDAYGLNVQYPGDKELSLEDQLLELKKLDGMSWIADIENDPRVNWAEVNLAYDRWKEKNSSLTPAASAIIAIAVACVTGPGGLNLMAGSAYSSTAMGVAMKAGVMTMINQTAQVVLSGNANNIGEVFDAVTSDEALKSLAVSMVTAGAIKKLDMTFGFENNNITNLAKEGNIAQANEAVRSIQLVQQAQQALVHATVSAGVSTIINGQGSSDFESLFMQSLAQDAINTIGNALTAKIGDAARAGNIDVVAQLASHAAVGCVASTASASLSGNDNSNVCISGAGGAVIGELGAMAHRERLEGGIEDFFYKLMGERGAVSDNELMAHANLLAAQGANMAQFAAALTAFAVGGDVDSAASSGYRAAVFNAEGDIPQIIANVREEYSSNRNVYSRIVNGTMSFGDTLPPGTPTDMPAWDSEYRESLAKREEVINLASKCFSGAVTQGCERFESGEVPVELEAVVSPDAWEQMKYHAELTARLGIKALEFFCENIYCIAYFEGKKILSAESLEEMIWAAGTFYINKNGTKIVSTKLDGSWKPLDISNQRNWNGCEECALAIQAKIGGDIYRITPSAELPGSPRLGTYRGTNPGWYHHEVVVKDGMVFDAFGPAEGVSIEEYKRLFEYSDVIDFGF